jgi:hypothetical protein
MDAYAAATHAIEVPLSARSTPIAHRRLRFFDATGIGSASGTLDHRGVIARDQLGIGKYVGNTFGAAVRMAEKTFHGKK